MVANIAARNALSPSVGDMVYVIDAGNTEYAFYVYSGGAWKLLADEDSANTDANTISATVTQAGGSGTTAIGTVSDGSRINLISCYYPITKICNFCYLVMWIECLS